MWQNFVYEAQCWYGCEEFLSGVGSIWQRLCEVCAVRCSLMMLAHAAGGQLGGWLGDVAAGRVPNAGRVIICQFSVAAGESFQKLLITLRSCLICATAPRSESPSVSLHPSWCSIGCGKLISLDAL